MNCRRGEIFFADGYKQIDQNGVEQNMRGRPFLIVSPDMMLYKSHGALCVPLTTQEKKPLPQHCKIDCLGRESIALCEQIRYMSEDRFGNYYCTVTDEEMAEVEKCLLEAVGISSSVLSQSGDSESMRKEVARITEGFEVQIAAKDAEIKDLQKEIEMLKIKEQAYISIIKG